MSPLMAGVRICVLITCALASVELGATIPTFHKTTLDERFFAEGAAFGDLNHDQQLDAIAGPYWYEGPEFKERHEIYAPTPHDPLKYSDNFFTFTHDFNRDGWTDVIVIGFPGTEAVWFENPKSPKASWTRHVVFAPVDNESPVFAHLFPGQPPVLLCVNGSRFGYATFDVNHAATTWTFHAITPTGPWQRYTHGLGFGDVNGDGRNDLLEAGGWWEQPTSLTGDPEWKRHPFPFAPERGGAQMYAFDVNGDGLNDVVSAHNAHAYGLSWYEQFKQSDGTISFREHAITSMKPDEAIADVQFSQPHALVITDVDSDGLPDLVTGKRWWAHGPEGDVDAKGTPVVYAFLLRRSAGGKAQFDPIQIDDASGVGTQFDTADVNADGYPDFIISNKRGSFLFRSSINGQSGEAPQATPQSAAIERAGFHLPPGFEIQLVASEPDIGKPLNINFDSRGRLWVSSTSLYPWPAKRDAAGAPIESFAQNWEANQLAFRAASSPPPPAEDGADLLHVLSEFGPDGRARKATVFADKLNIPTGVAPLPRKANAKGDSVIAFSIPAIWRFTDTDGDGVADRRERVYGEFGFKDTHGMSSNYTYWSDGWIYGTHGFSNHSEILDRSDQVTVLDSGNTYRFRADGTRFEQRTWGQTNPFGLSFDARGDVYTADSHSKPVYLVQTGGYYEGINKKHDGLGFAPAITSDDHGSSAIAGITYYAATHFPEEYRGNLFNGNPVTGRVNRDRLDWTGSSPHAVRMPDFISCDDPAFRPVQVKLGPDGALWIADFYNRIIGHYEVPLTHPSRDHVHGRIWRVVWRGLNGEVPVPTLPNLADASADELVRTLADPNLTVRTLAANELVDRIGAAAIPKLRAAASSAFAQPENLFTLQIANALERLGGNDDRQLFETLLNTSDKAGVTALRILASRTELKELGSDFFKALISRTEPGFRWRGIAEVFAQHPAPWQAPLVLGMLERTPEKDEQLVYALRLALKVVIGEATLAQLTQWENSAPHAGAALASVCLAVPRPIVAEYLLGYLERGEFRATNSGELARHAVQYLPSSRTDAIERLITSLKDAPLAQQLSLAEGLALASSKRAESFPESIDAWMKRVLTDAAVLKDWVLARRALEAAEPIVFPEMANVLRRLAVDREIQQYPLRFTAVRALPATPENQSIFVQVLNEGTAGGTIRKLAVDALGKPAIGSAGFDALVKAMPTAPSDVALAIAIVLSKTDAGAVRLVTEAEAGRAPVRLLVHGYVAPGLAERPESIRTKVAALTRNLPSENARLDGVIAARAMAYGRARPNLARGKAIFTEQCTSCHKLGNTGGSIGPSLDGLSSRGVSRIMEDILDPSRNIDPSFRLSTVTTRQGDPQTGMNVQLQGEQYVMATITGQQVNVPKDQVVSVAPINTSLMPGVFENTLTEEDFYSLVRFLVSPPGK